jgi:DNA repair protein RAD57
MSTESALPTTRLSQIAESLISTLSISPPPEIPSDDIDRAIDTLQSHGDRIYYYNCSDLEAQEHIVKYQLPVVLSRYNVGLIIIDSVTANYRAEFDRPKSSQASQMATRSKDLRRLAGTLKDLAIEHNVAVVAVNQVTDAFRKSTQSSQEEDLLTLDYQGKWFDGLVDEYGENMKKPALGLVWTNLITTRIMFVRDPLQTRMKVVFSPYAKPGSLVYAISTQRGVHAVEPDTSEKKVEDTTFSEGINFSDIDVEELWSDPQIV